MVGREDEEFVLDPICQYVLMPRYEISKQDIVDALKECKISSSDDIIKIDAVNTGIAVKLERRKNVEPYLLIKKVYRI